MKVCSANVRNIQWHVGEVSREDRKKLIGVNNKVIWLTGLSGSGKSTIARALEKKLHERGIVGYVLDGDNIRHGLNNDLGFSQKDREENVRRVSEVARLFQDAGIFVFVSFISPCRKSRRKAREIIGDDFVEVFVNCPLEECEKRDSKGLYAKARTGKIPDFTGVSAPYDSPENPEIVVETHKKNIDECVDKIISYLGI